MKRKAMFLFAVTLASGTAAADPVQPRKLATGAPACGNMLGKYGTLQAVPCLKTTPVAPAPKTYTADARNLLPGYAIVMTIVQEAQRIREHLVAANAPAKGPS